MSYLPDHMSKDELVETIVRKISSRSNLHVDVSKAMQVYQHTVLNYSSQYK